jgi:sulfonate transport system ATP-binding protein
MHDLLLTLWRNQAPAVLYITHDVDEAVTLADRALVLEQGRIIAEETVELLRPRTVDGEFQSVWRRLLGHLGVHVESRAPQESSLAPFPARSTG